jgi:hypothetical protein
MGTTRRKRRRATLIRDAGFDAVDAGPLRIARYAEPFTLLIGQLAYEHEGGPELAYRFERGLQESQVRLGRFSPLDWHAFWHTKQQKGSTEGFTETDAWMLQMLLQE